MHLIECLGNHGYNGFSNEHFLDSNSLILPLKYLKYFFWEKLTRTRTKQNVRLFHIMIKIILNFMIQG